MLTTNIVNEQLELRSVNQQKPDATLTQRAPMVDTPVCKHGWPVFDQDPCPDCLRAMLAQQTVTAPVTDAIPEFLQRPIGGKVAAEDSVLPSNAAKEVAPSVADATSTLYDDRSLGSVARRLGFPEDPDDALQRQKLLTESTTRSKNKAETRLQKAGFKAGREGEYAAGKTWDTRHARWI